MAHIQMYENGNISIGDKVLKVGRRRKKDFEKAYFEFDVLYGVVR